MEVIILDCNSLDDFEDEAEKILSPDRVEKFKSYVFGKDRALSIGAGLLMRYVENEYGVKILIDADGKPQTDKKDVNFNVSHSGEYAVCAISRHPVGIDIEAEEDYDDVFPSSTSPEEKKLFRKIPSDQRKSMFFRMWTVKESYLKAIGKGMSVSMDSVQALDEKGIVKNIGNWKITEIDSPEGYALTVCHNPEDCKMEIREFCGENMF